MINPDRAALMAELRDFIAGYDGIEDYVWSVAIAKKCLAALTADAAGRECSTCGGTGEIEVSQTRSAKCVRCDGNGRVPDDATREERERLADLIDAAMKTQKYRHGSVITVLSPNDLKRAAALLRGET